MRNDFIQERLQSYDDADPRRRREMFLMALELTEHYIQVIEAKNILLTKHQQKED